MTSRNWCFTIFGDWDHEALRDDTVVRAAVQKEKAPDTGREHYQGFVSLSSAVRMAAVKKLLKCESAHVEKAKGSPQQAWDYCVKEDSRVDGPWIFGERPGGQGNRYASQSVDSITHNFVTCDMSPPLQVRSEACLGDDQRGCVGCCAVRGDTCCCFQVSSGDSCCKDGLLPLPRSFSCPRDINLLGRIWDWEDEEGVGGEYECLYGDEA